MPVTLVLWLALFAAHPAQDAPAPAVAPQTAAPQPSQSADPEPKPDATGVYSLGNGVRAPLILKRVPPRPTPEAFTQGLTGTVAIGLIVTAKGEPHAVYIKRALADVVDSSQREAAATLDQAALEAVKQYKFQPATLNGVAIPVHITVQVSFFRLH